MDNDTNVTNVMIGQQSLRLPLLKWSQDKPIEMLLLNCFDKNRIESIKRALWAVFNTVAVLLRWDFAHSIRKVSIKAATVLKFRGLLSSR